MVTRTIKVPIKHESPLDEEFDKLVKETLERWKVPGFSVAVVDGDETYTKVNSPSLHVQTNISRVMEQRLSHQLR
jgi:hypothetical protein